MEEKYIIFYKKFIRHSKTLSDGGIEQNRELKRKNYEYERSSYFSFNKLEQF